MEASIITTYRCTNKCAMCNIWKYPSNEEDEFKVSLLEKLPKLSFCNITGGEPFLREDIEDIIKILMPKAKRLIISTNGYFTEKIVDLAKKNKGLGIRISIEGLPALNDNIRGITDGFDKALRTLLELKRLGMKDIGFGITVFDRNYKDLIPLYFFSKFLKVEFATAVVHNSYYFHKYDNLILKKKDVIESFRELTNELLKTWRLKNWFRAYFNFGLINYIEGNPRRLPCAAGTDFFFLDPQGQIRPCNGMEENIWLESMGDLHEKSFEEILNSEKASLVRNCVKTCPKNCWMIGSVSPAIKNHLWHTTSWVLKGKLQSMFRTSI